MHHKYLYHNGLLDKESFQTLIDPDCYNPEYLATDEGRQKFEKAVGIFIVVILVYLKFLFFNNYFLKLIFNYNKLFFFI